VFWSFTELYKQIWNVCHKTTVKRNHAVHLHDEDALEKQEKEKEKEKEKLKLEKDKKKIGLDRIQTVGLEKVKNKIIAKTILEVGSSYGEEGEGQEGQKEEI